MSEKPRRWFQIHLSTAVVMMFVAGGILWANCINREVNADVLKYIGSDGTIVIFVPRHVYGWPFGIYEDYNDPKAGGQHVKRALRGPKVTTDDLTNWNLLHAAFNTSLAAAVLAAVAFACEWRIRRREARKP